MHSVEHSDRNNAAITLADIRVPEIKSILYLNCTEMECNLLKAIKAFLPHMIENNQGHLVAISSIAGHFGQSYSAAYSASKFAIRGLMESLKWELDDMEQSGIKTTTIYPYFTQTALLSHVTPSSRFFENLSIDYTASNIISHILYEREEAFIPSIMSVFCLLIKQTSPPRVKAVWRKFFNVVYYTEDKPLENGSSSLPNGGKWKKT
uniref:Uncharacterized protein n=1 Tax=Romanomermis culicivorax TaxID=13658 RepID=A0A915KP51_ROMCU